MDTQKLERKLKEFLPTQERYKYKTGLLYSPGIQYLVDEVAADWVIALIANEQFKPFIAESLELQQFQSWELSTKGIPSLFCFRDLEQQTIASFSVQLWSGCFPLESLKLFVVEGVLMLPSELAS